MGIKLLGIDRTLEGSTQLHELGLIAEDIEGGEGTETRTFFPNGITTLSTVTRYRSGSRQYMYVRADAAIAQYDACEMKLDETDAPFAVIKTAGATSTALGICEIANVGANDFFWLTIRGYVPVANVADAAAQGDFLAPSATAGRLDAFTWTTVDPTLAQLLAGFKASIAGIRAVTDASASNLAAVYIHG